MFSILVFNSVTDDMNIRKKRSLEKKLLKKMKKAAKKSKRDVIDSKTVERTKQSPTKIKLEKTILETMKKP